jgi:hypothetical protein
MSRHGTGAAYSVVGDESCSQGCLLLDIQAVSSDQDWLLAPSPSATDFVARAVSVLTPAAGWPR